MIRIVKGLQEGSELTALPSLIEYTILSCASLTLSTGAILLDENLSLDLKRRDKAQSGFSPQAVSDEFPSLCQEPGPAIFVQCHVQAKKSD